jgi:hypothetical protein
VGIKTGFIFSYHRCCSSPKYGRAMHRNCSITTMESPIEPVEQVFSNFKTFRILSQTQSTRKKLLLKGLYECLPTSPSLLFNQVTHPVGLLRCCFQYILCDSCKPCALDPERLCSQALGETIQKGNLSHPVDSRVLGETHMKVLNVGRKLSRQICTNKRVVSDEEGLATLRLYKVVKHGMRYCQLEYMSDSCMIGPCQR